MFVRLFRLAVALLTLLVSAIAAAPSGMDGLLLSKNYGSRANQVRDSPLERVQVQQETGFDGRVRSIRFGYEPQLHRPNDQRLYSFDPFNYHPVGHIYTQNAGLSMRSTSDVEQLPRELSLFQSIPQPASKASRSKRQTEKEQDDLDTAESKVFRPLFVYRQQVSRRLRLQNNRRSSNNARQNRSRAKPRLTYYYYPYQYSPVYTYYR